MRLCILCHTLVHCLKWRVSLHCSAPTLVISSCFPNRNTWGIFSQLNQCLNTQARRALGCQGTKPNNTQIFLGLQQQIGCISISVSVSISSFQFLIHFHFLLFHMPIRTSLFSAPESVLVKATLVKLLVKVLQCTQTGVFLSKQVRTIVAGRQRDAQTCNRSS